MLIHRLLYSTKVLAVIVLYLSPFQQSFLDEEEELLWLPDHARHSVTEDFRNVDLKSHFKEPEFGPEHVQDSDSRLVAAIHGQNLVPPVARNSQIIPHTQMEGDFQNAAYQRSQYTKAHSPKGNFQPIATPSWDNVNPAFLNAPDDFLRPRRLATPCNPLFESSMTSEEGLGCLKRAPPLPPPQPYHATLSTAKDTGFSPRQNFLIPTNAIYPMTENVQPLDLPAGLTASASGSNLQHTSLKGTQDEFSDLAVYLSSIMGWDTPVSPQHPVGPYLGTLTQESGNQPMTSEHWPSPIWSYNSNDTPGPISDTAGIQRLIGTVHPQDSQKQYRREEEEVFSTQGTRPSPLRWSPSSGEESYQVESPLGLLFNSHVASGQSSTSMSSDKGRPSITTMETLGSKMSPTGIGSSPSHAQAGLGLSKSLVKSINLQDHSTSSDLYIRHMLDTKSRLVDREQQRPTRSKPLGELHEVLDAGSRFQPPEKRIRLLSDHGESEGKGYGALPSLRETGDKSSATQLGLQLNEEPGKRAEISRKVSTEHNHSNHPCEGHVRVSLAISDAAFSDSLDFMRIEPGISCSPPLSEVKMIAKGKLDKMLDIIKSDFPGDLIPGFPHGSLGISKGKANDFLDHVAACDYHKKLVKLSTSLSGNRRETLIERHLKILSYQEFGYLQSQINAIKPQGASGNEKDVIPLALAKWNEGYTFNPIWAGSLCKYQKRTIEAMKRALVLVRMVSTIFRDSPNKVDVGANRLTAWNFFCNFCKKADGEHSVQMNQDSHEVGAEIKHFLTELEHLEAHVAVSKSTVRFLKLWLAQFRPELLRASFNKWQCQVKPGACRIHRILKILNHLLHWAACDKML